MIGDDDYDDEDDYGDEDYVPQPKGGKKKVEEADYDFMWVYLAKWEWEHSLYYSCWCCN